MRQSLLTVLATLVIFFVLLFVYTKLAGPIPFSVNSVTTTKSDTFNVSGEGRVSVKPDIAIVRVGVQSSAPTVALAQQQLNESASKVSTAIKGLGVDAADIKTENYNINPNYDFREGSQRITGYSATSNLVVEIKDINKVNSIVDVSTANGANLVGNVTFDVDDKSKAEDEARKKAVEDAKKKAQQAAQIAGFQLGRLINYSESQDTPEKAPLLARDAVGTGSSEPSTQIEPGTNEIVINVYLSYEIR